MISRSIVFLVVVFSFIYIVSNGYYLKENSNSQSNGAQHKYSKVRIFAASKQDFKRIDQAGLYLDGGIFKQGIYFDTWLSEQEIKKLSYSGIQYQVLVDDWYTYYNNLPKMSEMDVQRSLVESKTNFNVGHSIYGSMGGFLTWSEVVKVLDSLRLEYPNFISKKWSIGNTYEGRPMWCIRITKDPDNIFGTPRPEIMLHALIHAREPEGMEQQLYFIYWLLENYGADPVATYILTYRDIYWIPVYNVDGYVYNETTVPNGGGMWRMNRQPCSGDTGTDLNRNYGTYQFWNSTNGGSSDMCGDETYRGSSPFSAPEVLNMANFVNSMHFKTALTAHTFGNYLIRPWCWSDSPTIDDTIFQEYSIDMTQYNHYTYGRPSQTVGYQTRGSSDDWNYNDSGHTKIIEMTPETGLTGFWPTQSEIIPLAEGMLWMNQYICLVAGPYVLPISKVFDQPYYQPGQSGNLKVIFRNKGLTAAANLTVSLVPGNSRINIPVQQYTYASLAPFTADSSIFNFTIEPDAPNNCAIPATLSIKLDTSTIYTANLYVYVGSGVLTLVDDAENGITNWTAEGGWMIKSDQSHSPSHSFGYSPYPANANYSLILAQPINILFMPVCYLTFWQRYDLEHNYDFGYVEVSSNNGSDWQTIASFTGTDTVWTQQTYDITSFANYTTVLKIRFRLNSDSYIQNTGWWVDDIKLTNYCIPPEAIPGKNKGMPDKFALGQNYPNPFNPATNIKFQLPRSEFVTITIYDVLGKKVATLLNERKNPGYYDVSFDGTNYASGMYFYKIEAGNFIDTKKMILIK
ncbi:MAG: M14 family zinc carboxypeptidase [Ignavibacteria bacterium]|jgi:hypothetical protein